MISKPILLAAPGTNCTEPCQAQHWQQYFDIQPWQLGDLVPQHAAAVIQHFTDTTDYSNLGMKIVVDHLWDSAVTQPCETHNNTLTLRAPDWVWIIEQWLGLAADYDVPRIADDPDQFMLMPLNLQRQHRDQLLQASAPWLPDSTWSYVSQGTLLPNDEFVPHPSHLGTANDRNYRPEWYAMTCFSMVSETAVNTAAMGLGIGPGHVFVSEKSFKPLAYQHPFVIQGTANTLTYLHSRGFGTFSEMINESYDAVVNDEERFQAIVLVLKELYQQWQQQGSVFQTPRTKEIVLHNYHRFWDEKITNDLFRTQIVQAIQEFIES
jgi:hypothetical protein